MLCFPSFCPEVLCYEGASVLSPDPDFRRVTEKQRPDVILNLAPCICLSESEMGIFVNLAGICQGTEEAGRLGKESVLVESGPTGCYLGCRRSITIAPEQSVCPERQATLERMVQLPHIFRKGDCRPRVVF